MAHDVAIGGVPASELAASYGTPLFIIDQDEFDLEVDVFTRAFLTRGITVAYAGKAFLCVAFAETLAATPLWLDVCSLGELLTAEGGGFPAGRIYFHGCGKTDEELRAIVERRVAFDVVDNIEELERLAVLARDVSTPIDIVLRLNTGIEAHTHAYIRTGGENTKFGMAPGALDAVAARIAALPQLRLIGLHSHIGSQIADIAPLRDNLTLLIASADRVRAAGHPVRTLIAGGGIGVEERPQEPRPLEIDTLAAALAQCAATTPYQVAIEPGRALVARAGTSLYRVMAMKLQGRRQFVIVDGGMADNPRPALYRAVHHLDVLTTAASAPLVDATLVGRACENDELGAVKVPADIRAGDLVALRTTGAYTYSMASNYNRFGRPPVVFVRDGTHRCVIRGERPEDVMRNDIR